MDKVILKEVKSVSWGVLFFGLAVQAVFLMLGRYDYTVFLGSLYGGILSILNFLFLSMTIQKIVHDGDEDTVKKKFTVSYRMRSIYLVLFTVLGIIIPAFNTVAVVCSLIFPKFYYFLIPLFRKDLRKQER